jgi:hypothetical protein
MRMESNGLKRCLMGIIYNRVANWLHAGLGVVRREAYLRVAKAIRNIEPSGFGGPYVAAPTPEGGASASGSVSNRCLARC